jgi:hypothetical protein
MQRPLPLWTCTIALFLLAVGCSRTQGEGKKVLPKGRVTNGGKVIPVKPMVGRLQIRFYPYREGSDEKLVDPQEAVVDAETGTFEVKGPEGKGIPAGKYRICVMYFDSFPPPPNKLDESDIFKGKFAPGKSPIIRDIDGSSEIIIDVSKPQG